VSDEGRAEASRIPAQADAGDDAVAAAGRLAAARDSYRAEIY
jgi:hypothetical protein